MNESQNSPSTKRNLKNILVIIGILILLLAAYYFGSHSRQSAEVIIPAVHSADTAVAHDASSTQPLISGGVYEYTEAGSHIGENASIKGTVVDIYTSKTGTTFFDFCKSYKTCSFSAVIFASKASSFPNVKQYTGQSVMITGTISSYQGKAEIIIDSPSQISVQ